MIVILNRMEYFVVGRNIFVMIWMLEILMIVNVLIGIVCVSGLNIGDLIWKVRLFFGCSSYDLLLELLK